MLHVVVIHTHIYIYTHTLSVLSELVQILGVFGFKFIFFNFHIGRCLFTNTKKLKSGDRSHFSSPILFGSHTNDTWKCDISSCSSILK